MRGDVMGKYDFIEESLIKGGGGLAALSVSILLLCCGVEVRPIDETPAKDVNGTPVVEDDDKTGSSSSDIGGASGDAIGSTDTVGDDDSATQDTTDGKSDELPSPADDDKIIIGQCEPALAADAEVSFKIDTLKSRKAISPYIYGSNRFNFLRPDWKDQEKANWTLARSGGAGYNTLNWEINATNCGTSNNYMNVPWGITFNPEDYPLAGQGQGKIIEQIFQHKAAIIVTIPMFPYVAADRNWTNVTETNDYVNTRFKKNRARKGAPFTLTPDPNDDFVYQDEYVNWIEHHYGQKNHPENPPIFYQIDNEPSLWDEVFHHLDTTPWTYQEFIQTYTEFASAIKDVNPDAIIIGGGFGSMQPLMILEETAQTPQQIGMVVILSHFLLIGNEKAESVYGHRLIDVVDLHWYSQATYPDDLQIARTLWDPVLMRCLLFPDSLVISG